MMIPWYLRILCVHVQMEVRHEFIHGPRFLNGMDILVKGVPLIPWNEKGRTTN